MFNRTLGILALVSAVGVLYGCYLVNNEKSFEVKPGAERLRFAFIVSGSLRSLVRDDVRDLQREALFEPLAGSHIDIFLNLDLDETTKNSTVVQKLKQDYRPKRLVIKTYECQDNCEVPGCLSNAITTSRTFEQLQRLQDVMVSIQAEERSIGIDYDFIIRVRPDLEFYESLPRLECWKLIPDMIIWDLDARFSDSHEHLMISHVVPATDVKFLGDWFTVVPRKLATKFFSDPFKQLKDCVSLDPQNTGSHTCGTKNEFWLFPECRFLVSAQKLNAHIGKLMDEGDGSKYIPHTIIRCDGPFCQSVYRMNGPRFCDSRVCEYPPVEHVPVGSNFSVRQTCFHGFPPH